jgi:predicted DNA-binding mobile mystery protein A
MNYWDHKLMREQLDDRLESLSVLRNFSRPEKGWIRSIREGLGMTTTELGRRAGISQSRISRLESAEIEGDLLLSSLQKLAEGMGMKFVYAFVPPTSITEMVGKQALKHAEKRMAKVNHTMRLENQEIDEDEKKRALETLAEQILHQPPRNFWGL